ncbi:hypothetical protein F2Q68_00031187 [Brassica cretica]|uniref:Uncharacterized protein n=1 Tax=Brassica cretica TaxID=69181 RepID=A0A8S9GCP3_BRACR|nr:hypothetical protein F2Q68_00031187 [Brassica cretica]KAF3600117.1 hypothetical protein F2Q69_00035810 [Brassica cretica]
MAGEDDVTESSVPGDKKPAKKCCENHHFPESKARTFGRLNRNNPVMGTSRRKLPF